MQEGRTTTGAAPSIDAMPEPFQRNHITSVTYLNGWANDGAVRVIRPGRHRGSKAASPESVGYRKRFWSATDPAVQEAAEKACGKLEVLFPEMLEKVRTAWPLKPRDREPLAEFISLHAIRTPAWKERHERSRSGALEDMRREWDEPVSFEEATASLRSDHERVKAFKRHLHLTTAIVANMHWTLISWRDACLATSDHPVSLFPWATPGVLRPYERFPAVGSDRILEIRFPLSPRELLVGSWLDGNDLDLPLLGDEKTAINANESTIGRTEIEWFFRPGSYPLLTPVVERNRRPSTPISFDLIGADAMTIVRSRRRRHAFSEANRITETDDSSYVSLIDFGQRRRAQRAAA